MMKSSTSSGKKLPKNLKNMDKLIAAVQARECLWDKNFRGHRNRFKLERLWNEVAAEVGTTSVSCRKRWKNLKDQCRKVIKKEPADCEWPHFQKLHFIHNQFTNEDDDNERNETQEESFSGLDDSIKRPKLGYTIRKKFLVNKRRTIDVDLNKLIELVQAHEIIWNRQLKGHHNWYKLDQNWKEIAEQLGVTRDEARLKWKYLRDQARKECRKADSEWDLLPKLQFLVNQFNENEYDNFFRGSLQNDEAYYKMEPESEAIETAMEPPEMQDEGVNNDDDDEIDEFDGKPELFETDFCDVDDEPLQPVSSTAVNAQDEDMSFFNSLLPHIKNLRADKKLMLRMKIQELVYKTVYNDG